MAIQGTQVPMYTNTHCFCIFLIFQFFFLFLYEGVSSKNPNFSKDKVGQSSSNSLGQQCFGCQGYGHVKVECPTYLRSKGKAMAITLSDDQEEFDHK